MEPGRAGAIAVGGALGATLRWAVVTLAPAPTGFPWTIFAVNVAGSALLGAALAEEWRRPAHRRFWHDAVAVGFCGGMTTFSTFALELANLLDDARPGLATLYLTASIVAGVLAAMAGARAVHRVRDLQAPVEET